jgi:hypothetical protein
VFTLRSVFPVFARPLAAPPRRIWCATVQSIHQRIGVEELKHVTAISKPGVQHSAEILDRLVYKN